MPLKITQDCINCAACADVCPNDGISRGNSVFVINPAKCTECVGFHNVERCIAICPAECIIPKPRLAMTEQALFERAKQLHADAARQPKLSPETSHFQSRPGSKDAATDSGDKPVGWWDRLFGKKAEPTMAGTTESK